MINIVPLEPEWLSDDVRAAFERGCQALTAIRKRPQDFHRWPLLRQAEWYENTQRLAKPFIDELVTLYESATRPRYLIKP